MTTEYARDGIAYRSYVRRDGGLESFELSMVARDAYRDCGVPSLHVTLRSEDGRSLDRLRNDEIVPETGAVVLTSDSNGGDHEAWDVLHQWALRHGVTRVVSVLVCPPEPMAWLRLKTTLEMWEATTTPGWRVSVWLEDGGCGWEVESIGGREKLPRAAGKGPHGIEWAKGEAEAAWRRVEAALNGGLT